MKPVKVAMVLLVIFYSFTGYSQELVSKANAFLTALPPNLKVITMFEIGDAERFNWHFVPLERKGITFRDLSETQRTYAWDFLKAAISSQGFEKAYAITQLEKVLMVLENQSPENHFRDPLNYHFLIFGTPSVDKPWGWRFEGHHCSLSFMVDKGKIVSSTPSFFGTNPGIVETGSEAGKEVLKLETDLGFKLVQSLSKEQLRQAVFAEAAPPDILSFNKRKAAPLPAAGIPYSSLSDDQKSILMRLLDAYILNYELGFSAQLASKIRAAGLDKLCFAWSGSITPGKPSYYRIQGPVLLIEYDNTQNNANHVHCVVRDLTNDFAEDVLGEHYRTQH